MGETNACISSCALDNRTAWPQLPCLLSVFNDKESSPVFDAATGILKFSFSKDIAAGVFRELFQTDERCFSNC